MKKTLFVTDVDGVLLDWTKDFKAWLDDKGIKTKTEEPLVFDLQQWLVDQTLSAKALIIEFNDSPAFAKLSPYADAMKALPKLAQDFDLVAITSCSSDPQVVQNRLENLKIFGVDFSEIHCLPLGVSKEALLRQYLKKDQISYWVEDNADNAHLGSSIGYLTFLLTRSYNEKIEKPGLTRVSSWDQILNKVYA